jgi:hypothetical protein
MKTMNTRIGKNMRHALNFARLNAGWYSYAQDRATAEAIRRLARAGLIEINNYRQFRLASKPKLNQQTKPPYKMKTKNEIRNEIEATPLRGAWGRAVKTYAIELLDGLNGEYSAVALLNGAENWRAYSYGGCALVYDSDIAERLCSPSEYKRKRGGELAPSSRESWLDCQARALSQAARLISRNA